MFQDTRIRCSLWGEFATDIENYFSTHDNTKLVVLIVQFGRLRKYMGKFFSYVLWKVQCTHRSYDFIAKLTNI